MNECYYYTATGQRYQSAVNVILYNHKLVNKHGDV